MCKCERDTAGDIPDSLHKTLGGSEITVVGSEARNCYPQGQVNKMMIIMHFYFFRMQYNKIKPIKQLGDC